MALTLLSVGMLGVAGLAGLMARDARRGQLESRIAVLAGSEIERLLAAGPKGFAPGSRPTDGGRVEWRVDSTDSTEVRVTVELSIGPRSLRRVLAARLARW